MTARTVPPLRDPAPRGPGLPDLPDLLTAELPTPAGVLAVVVDPDAAGGAAGGPGGVGGPAPGWGAVVSAGFDGLAGRLAVLGPEAAHLARPAPLRAVAEALAAYADGDLDALGRVPVAQPGTPFRRRVWAAMREVPAGATVSYAQLAADAGFPLAVRAAASACATNRVAPFVPCHRVVRADGTIGGYGYGVEVKRRLLAHEGVVA